jgi:hypothetical protein
MVANKIKIIDPKKERIEQTRRDNWEVMKPFVSFAYKAMKVIGLGLITIVKALPLLKPHKPGTTVKHR